MTSRPATRSSADGPDGRFDVALTVVATKLYADGAGRERPAPMNETVNIGLFARKPG